MLACRGLAEGSILVSKVAGNVHVVLGEGAAQSGTMQHRLYQFTLEDLESFNASHYVHKLGFGEDLPGVTNPLDNVHNELARGTGQYVYYIRVVPSTYRHLNGKSIHSNEYSVTEQLTMVDLQTGTFPHPGVFFKYDFSPIMVEYRETHPSIFSLCTSLCAIVGGVFTVFHLIDSFRQGATEVITGKKLE